MNETITVLRTFGPLLAKTWKADGSIRDYDQAKRYTVVERPAGGVAGLHALLELLGKLNDDPRSCIIRGAPAAPLPDDLARVGVHRNLSVFSDRATRLFMLDCDSFVPATCDPVADPRAAVAEFVATLPECFQDTSYVAQLSGSMGHPTKAGMLRCHLWFWLAEPLTCDQAERWSAKWLPGVDKTVHRVVQANYTAAPVLEGGQADPFAGRRIWLVDSMFDVLVLPHDMPVPDATTVRVARENRRDLVDPRGKPGLIGALCRAFEPADIVTLFPEHFEAGTKPERLTWLAGGGAREGLRITDSGTHLYNSHSTAPTTSACNLFDFLRLHVFGHLDAAVDPDVLAFEPTAAPSYIATETWARKLPEVQAELGSPAAEEAKEVAADARAERQLSVREQATERFDACLRSIELCTDLDLMQHDIGHKVARTKLFDDAHRELIARAIVQRTGALGRRLTLAIVRPWLRPVTDEPTQVFQDVTAEGAPKATIENLECLTARCGITIRYNAVTKMQEIAHPDWHLGSDDRLSSAIAMLQSECARADMAYHMGFVKGAVCTIAARNEYNPVLLMIESRPWDGVSRVQALVDSLKSAPGADGDLKHLIVKTWLIQCVAVACSPRPIQARGVLVLQGPQYQGKSRWLKSLMPPGLEDLVLTGLQLDVRNKDHVKLAISHWLVELGELEGTFRKSDIAALKAWIAQDVDVLRLPYAPAESRFQRRMSAFASANEEEFLDDPTGLTRWWVLRIETMNTEHGVDMQQLWAEIFACWDWGRGANHWLSQDDMNRVTRQSEVHSVEDPITEMLRAAFPWGQAVSEPETVEWLPLSPTAALRIAGMGNVTQPGLPKRAGHALKKLGARRGQRTSTSSIWHVPALPGQVPQAMTAV